MKEIEKLNKYSIYLCSQSPRRRELMKMLDINFMVASKTEIDETYPESLPPEDIPVYLANKKADAYQYILKKNRIIITADTIVILNGKILGKPHNSEKAKDMLQMLSGQKHTVISGVCISDSKKRYCFSSKTDVWFAHLSDEEINYYVEKYKPFDKAGAYGIQEWIGYIGINAINGSYFNVVGLPVQRLYKELLNFVDL